MAAAAAKGWIAIALTASMALAGCVNTATPAEGLLAATNDAPANGNVREFHIYVSEATPMEPHEGKTITGFGFSHSPEGPFTVPAPEIRVRQGDTVRATLHSVGVGHTIHWHGLKLPWAMDGVPFMTQTILPGNSTYTYEFVARESGTYWYHCHVDAPSHIDFGLFGPLVIEPADPADDPPFDREFTMMLSEVDSFMFAGFSGAFGGPDLGNHPHNPIDAAEAGVNMARTSVDLAGVIAGEVTGADEAVRALGFEAPRSYYDAYSIRYRPQYDTFMINGKSFPETEPLFITTGETIRIRLINAGQLVHSMHLHGTHFLVTHKDGYKLPAAYYADTILVGPAERYDLYVVGDNPGMWDFHDHGGAWNVGGYTSNDHAFPGGMNTMLIYEDWVEQELPEPAPEGATSGDFVRAAIRAGLIPAPLVGQGGHAGHAATLPTPVAQPHHPGEPLDPLTGQPLR